MKRIVNPSSALAQSDLGEFVGAFRFPLRTILSFEFALVLLISVGAWKANPAFAWMFPVDATLIMAAVCSVCILKYLLTRGFPRRLVTPVAFYFAFCLW